MASVLDKRFPIVTLDNGLTLVNYGSPHKYLFHTGEELDKCVDDVCRDTSLISNHNYDVIVQDNAGGIKKISLEDTGYPKIDDGNFMLNSSSWKEYVMQYYPEYKNHKMWLDVFINYQVSDKIVDDLVALGEMDIIDIILVPYPLMNAWSYETRINKEIAKNMVDGIEEFYNTWEFALLKMRTCKLQDRVTKIIYSDQFCGSAELRALKVLPLSKAVENA